ncbi:pseudouridine synthase [Butyrivibrio sp. NC2002]|uniref:pseudouridine synthase n=1 Tax=Butyrivibrio sp. NC2002 TaxID=1410610 RepID=UPI000565933F|nr:pseudouridine synthase [Butyrivibrio sp. NC2002]
MRLDKFLSDCGLGTRKQLKEYIKNGMVTVDGNIISKPEFAVDPNKNEILFSGESLTENYSEFRYYILNKPQGVVSATKDNHDKTVLDLIDTGLDKNLAPVGRLDKDTEGLLIITNDGKLTHSLLSPKKHVEKEYVVYTRDKVLDEDIRKLEEGLDIGDEEPTLPAKAFIKQDENGEETLHLILHEGRFHQVKRMLLAVGNEVTFLRRIRMGKLSLTGDLKVGEYRELTKEELSLLQEKNTD